MVVLLPSQFVMFGHCACQDGGLRVAYTQKPADARGSLYKIQPTDVKMGNVPAKAPSVVSGGLFL
jgi:hypothetical protein